MKSQFILFYMNGCGYCVMFEPIWNELKNNHGNKYDFIKCESDNLNSSKEAQDIKAQLNIDITGFPSIFCKVDNKYYKYEGNRTEEDLLNFVESKTNKSIKDESIKDKSIKDKSNSSSDISISDNSKKNVKLYYFYMNNCKWCEKFNSLWEDLKDLFANYECESSNIENSKEAEKIKSTLNLQIDSFPAIFIKINDLYYKYNGERTMRNILKFIAKVIKKDKLIQKGGKVDYRNKYKKYKQMYFEVLDKLNKLNLD